ncbi:MAG: hypothetical protein L3J63_11610, partial [Geopsychrobacter sp.]|nr:hypothetical protein [Geopsychrobacter sp.]
SYLAASTYPEGWPSGRQAVLSESLPTTLSYTTAPTDPLRLQVRLRSGTHRVMDMWLAPAATEKKISVTASLQPLESLRHLPFKESSTSFYETDGSRKGYVKGSYKPRERLLMSWWALAWKIGQDKSLGKDRQDGTVFYTSLKPWARKASDMRDFANFLNYWGWKL